MSDFKQQSSGLFTKKKNRAVTGHSCTGNTGRFSRVPTHDPLPHGSWVMLTLPGEPLSLRKREKERERCECLESERRRYREWIRSRSKLKINPKVVTPAGSAVKRCKWYRICRVTQVMFSHTHRCTHAHIFQLVTRHFIYNFIPEDPDTRTCNHMLIYTSTANAHRELQATLRVSFWWMEKVSERSVWKMKYCLQNEYVFCFMDRKRLIMLLIWCVSPDNQFYTFSSYFFQHS